MNCMSSVSSFRNVCAISLALSFLLAQPMAWSARKYYPPGFTPEETAPALQDPPSATPSTAPGNGKPQVIIRNVAASHKPKDRLEVLIDEQRYYEALRLLNKRLDANPNNESLRLLKGQLLRSEGNYDDSLHEYEAVLKKTRSKPTKSLALNGIGWTAYSKARHLANVGDQPGADESMAAAKSAFKQALTFNPRQLYALTGLVESSLVEGNLSEAESYLKRAERINPTSIHVQINKSRLSLARKQPEETLSRLFKLKASQPQNQQVYLLLAEASLMLDRTDDAIIHLKQLLDMAPGNTQALKMLSAAYERKMRPEDAEQTLQRALTVNPKDSEAMEGLLKIYEDRGEHDRSILTLRSFLKDSPDHDLYRYKLTERLYRNQRWQELYPAAYPLLDRWLDSGHAELPSLIQMFSHAFYAQSAGLLEHNERLSDPVIQETLGYLQNALQKDPADYGLRLSYLFFDPLVTLPALPEDAEPENNGELALALQAAYLEGDDVTHRQMVSDWLSFGSDDAEFLRQSVALGHNLLQINDYEGAAAISRQLLEQYPDSEPVKTLSQALEKRKWAAQEQLTAFEMMPKKLPGNFWEKTAQGMLQLNYGNGEAHALLAKALEKKDLYVSALYQQRLAAQYAQSKRDRKHWTKRAEKTAKRLNKA